MIHKTVISHTNHLFNRNSISPVSASFCFAFHRRSFSYFKMSYDPFPSIREQLTAKIEELERRANDLAQLRRAGTSQTDWIEAGLRNQYDDARDLLMNIKKANESVAMNPQRFSISPEELQSRQNFVEQSNQRLSMVQKQLDVQEKKKETLEQKKTKIRKQAEAENQRFIENEINEQQQMIMEQDRQLDIGFEGVQVVHQMANEINYALQDDEKIRNELENKMDKRQTDLDRLNKKVLELLNTPRTWMIVGCVILTIIVVVLIIWVFVM